MKWNHCVAPALAFALMAPPVMAQTPGQPAQPQQETERPAERQDGPGDRGDARQPGVQGQPGQPDQRVAAPRDAQGAEAQQHVIRAERLIGQAVRGARNERLGRISDLAVNVDDKRVVYAVVSRGGVWGIGGEDVGVQWQQIRPDQAERVVKIDDQQLQQARGFDTGRNWPLEIGEGPIGTSGAAPEHGVLPMSSLIGMDVHNMQGERLGQIDDIAIERDGSLGYAVIAYGGFLGVGDSHVAVPWDRLTLDAERQGAVMDTTREQLDQAQPFEYRDTWPERVDWPFGDDRQGQDRQPEPVR